MTPARILVVEDERITAYNLESQLKKLGHSVVANVASGEEAVAAAERERPDCVLMDIHLAGAMDGIAAGSEIIRRWALPVVYLTAYVDDDTVARAGATAPYGYLVKPFEIRGVEAALRVAVARRDAERALAESEARLKLALQAARLSDFEFDADVQRLRCHRHALDLPRPESVREYGVEELLAQVHRDDRARVSAVLEHALAADGLIDAEFRVAPDRHRRDRWLRIAGRRIGASRRIFGVVEDVSERRAAHSHLQQAARILEAAGEAIFTADADWRLESANPAYHALIDPDARVGTMPRVLAAMTDAERSAVRERLARDGLWRGELSVDLAETGPRTLWASFAHAGEGLIGVLSDISGLKSAQAHIERLAYHDALTGLPNRTLARDRMEQALLRAERGGAAPALLYVDLDRFKAINDTLGHAAGDAVLVEAARRMRGAIRRSDTLARLAGDEFLVIVDGEDAAQSALTVADKLLQALVQPFAIGGQSVTCGASIGVAVYPRDGTRVDELLRAADHAMYQAKAGGGMRYRASDPQLIEALMPVWRFETELRRALLHGEFVLHYQLQRDQAGRVIGAEALARWRHPERGLVGPEAFIDALERLGLMDAFTAWALAEACDQLARWRDATHPVGRVAVNVPPSALQNCALAELVAATLAERRLPGECLELEITESALQTGLEAFACLDRIVETGVAVVLDDFGTGYANLVSLKHLPLVRLKIDREFVSDIEHNPTSLAVVETILGLSARLNLDVLAEGVEMPAQRAVLERLGCTRFQGFLFDRPLPPEALALGTGARSAPEVPV